MNKSIVRCRCGHQVLSKEVLRTDLYERRAPGDASRDYVYVKYRCQRCKRMGETFVAESRWDWAMLEAEPNEMTDQERDRFLDEEIVTPEDVLDFHRELETFSLSDLAAMTLDETELPAAPETLKNGADAEKPTELESRPVLKTENLKAEAKVENAKVDNGITDSTSCPPDEPRNESQDGRRNRK